MNDVRRCAGLAPVVLLAACAAAAGDESGAAPPVESVVWGDAVAMPWDDQRVDGSAEERLLNTAFDLTRRAEPGEVRVYETRRVNITCGPKGEILNRTVSEARVRRTAVEETGPGIWRQRIEWERFAWGMGVGPDQHPEAAEMPGARGIAYDFTPGDFDHVDIPAEFERVGDPMIGYQMKVLAMDVHTWDGLIDTVREKLGPSVNIGASTRSGFGASATISEVGGAGEVGEYRFGENALTLAGVTRCQGEPCALIWYAADGNGVSQKMSSPAVALEMEGTEYFRALITVSLRDGHLVAGELWGPVVTEMKLGFGGQPPELQPISAIVGSVSIWEVPSTETAAARPE